MNLEIAFYSSIGYRKLICSFNAQVSILRSLVLVNFLYKNMCPEYYFHQG